MAGECGERSLRGGLSELTMGQNFGCLVVLRHTDVTDLLLPHLPHSGPCSVVLSTNPTDHSLQQIQGYLINAMP